MRVWRAVPEGVTAISPGDWVALSEKYARAESQIEHAQVITATATASELWSEGLLEEWGYQGTAPLRAEPAAAERPLSRASSLRARERRSLQHGPQRPTHRP